MFTRHHLLPPLAALLLVVPGLSAEGEEGREGHRHPDKEQLEKRFDADGDGTLNEEERAALDEARAAHRQERDRGAHGEGMREELLERFDADGDGKLDEAERAAAKEALRERAAGHREELLARLEAEHPKVFARIDKDGDGTINDEEFAAAREHLKEFLQRRRGDEGDARPARRPGDGEHRPRKHGDGEAR